jgi:hypothetical protein
MDETILTQPQLKTTADYKAAFAHLLEQVTAVEKKMQGDRNAIERLKVETWILKAESDIIKARTQERLDALMVAG